MRVAITPCPNDTFSFYFFLKRNPHYQVDFLDIQTLNEKVLEKKDPYDIIKLSFAIWDDVEDQYTLLKSGSALGENVGPVLVRKKPLEEIQKKEKILVALPGEYTTASFLFHFYVQHQKSIKKEKIEKKYLLYSKIEEALSKEEVDLGVLIHEGRFSYSSYGLSLVVDLGEFYLERKKVRYIPLGGIFLRNSLLPQKEKIEEELKKSIQDAYFFWERRDSSIYKELFSFIKSYAQSLSEEVIRKHIQTYVNKESIELSQEGRKSLEIFYQELILWKGKKRDY